MKRYNLTYWCSILIISISFSFSAISQTCGSTITSYPYNEDFESGIGGWTQDTGDDFNWTRRSGGTPSGNTGPSSTSSGSYYMYTEATSNFNNTSNFESPCFDLTSLTNPELSFIYHMYGADMGTLNIDISTDNGSTYSTTLWTQSGQVQTSNGQSWNTATIDLSTYTSNTVKIRFQGITGSGYRSDIAIDNISLINVTPNPEIDVQGNSVSIADGDLTPSTTDYTNFGTANIGTLITRTYTISNSGSGNLTISSISLSNSIDFSITGTPYSTPIASSGSTTFSITFNSLTLNTKSCTITINNDDADEGTYQFGIEARAEQNFFDSDGDGVYDNIDIDDDNDGIIDSEEELSCQNASFSTTANYKFLNETFGEGNRTTINTTYDATTTYCYEDGTVGTSTTECPDQHKIDLNDGKYTVYYKAGDGDGTNDTPVEEVASWADNYWYTGEDHTSGDTNGRMAMFNASYDPGIFYTATIIGALPNVPVTYSFWVLNLDTTDAPGIATRLRPNILVEFRDVNNNVLASIATGDIPPSINGDPANSWHQFTANLTFSVSEFYVFFINNEVGGGGNDLAIDDIVISQTLCDTDNDGVADVFDLDSDNDGIPDVVEAGLGNYSEGKATLTGTSSWVDTNVNGMHDAAESHTPLDTDGDATPNYLDLDSDNDSIFDVDESGAGNTGDSNYQNGDGDITGDGVGDGTDTDAVRETDIESDGTSEYFTDGILDIYDFYEGITFSTAYGNENQGLGSTYYVLDSDGDGTPDYMDKTSDGSTFDISHTLYASLDANNDGVIDDTNDAEGDGIVDLFDTDDTAFGSPRDLERKLHLYFDGRNDYASETTLIDEWNEASMMGWIKLDPSSTGTQIIMGQNQFYLQLNGDKTITAYADGNSLSCTTPLSTNQWTHISATYSCDCVDGEFKLFINGEVVNSTPISSGTFNTDTSSFTIGRMPDTDSNYFHGYIDELRVFNKALTENELQKIVYQEIKDNSGVIRGEIIPKDIDDYDTATDTSTPLNWSKLERYYKMDIYKDDIIDDLTTASIDVGSGCKIYNTKLIDVQSAPLPFITQANGSLPTSLTIASDGINGNDAINYDWSIIHIKHSDIDYNANQKHIGLIIDEEDASSTPIEFTINGNSELNVSWYLKLDGKIDLEGESQLVQGPESELDYTSKGTLEKDQQGTADTFTYNFWSSPVGLSNETSNNNSYTTADIFTNVTFLTSGYNGTASPLGIADYWIWKFSNQESENYSKWQHARSTNTILAGEGFTMKGPGSGSISTPQNYILEGKPNNGDISLPINSGNDYLVGNPYPSALDARQFILDNGATINGAGTTTGTLYFWEHWGGGSHILKEYQGGYATYSLSGGTPSASHGSSASDVDPGGSPTKIPGQYIPVAQGFFVMAEATGTIKFNNGQRVFQVEDGTNSVYVKPGSRKKKKAKTENKDARQKLRLGFNSVNTIHRQILVTVDSLSTTGIDWGFDALHIDEQIDDMYWMIDDKKYNIQGIDEINTNTIIPIGLHTKSDGLNTITIDKLENFVDSDIAIYVHDKNLNIYHNLQESDYEIYLEAGNHLERFEITFDNSQVLSNNSIDSNQIELYFSNEKESVVIQNPFNKTIKSVSLFNILGQSVFNSISSTNNNYIEYKTANLTPGAYVLNIKTEDGNQSKKVLIN